VDNKLATALQKHDTGRTGQTKLLVPLILDDVRDHAKHLDEVLAASPDSAAVIARLKALSKQVRPNSQDAEPDPLTPKPQSMQHVVCGRWMAARAALSLCDDVCLVVDTLGILGLVVLPGGVKKDPRIVMKAFLKHGGDFSLVEDMSRITVVVDTLEQLADVVGRCRQAGTLLL